MIRHLHSKGGTEALLKLYFGVFTQIVLCCSEGALSAFTSTQIELYAFILGAKIGSELA